MTDEVSVAVELGADANAFLCKCARVVAASPDAASDRVFATLSVALAVILNEAATLGDETHPVSSQSILNALGNHVANVFAAQHDIQETLSARIEQLAQFVEAQLPAWIEMRRETQRPVH